MLTTLVLEQSYDILLPRCPWSNPENVNKWIIQYIPRNMHTVFALLCFVVVIHWLIFPYPSGLLHWHCGNLTIAPVPAKQTWWIWINTSCEFIMNNCITTTKQSTTKPCVFFLGYTVSTKQHSTCLLHCCRSNHMIYYGHGVHEVTQKIWINKSYVWGRDQMDAVSQTTLSNAFSWMKMLEFRLGFHWSLFLKVQLIIFQHWFR